MAEIWKQVAANAGTAAATPRNHCYALWPFPYHTVIPNFWVLPVAAAGPQPGGGVMKGSEATPLPGSRTLPWSWTGSEINMWGHIPHPSKTQEHNTYQSVRAQWELYLVKHRLCPSPHPWWRHVHLLTMCIIQEWQKRERSLPNYTPASTNPKLPCFWLWHRYHTDTVSSGGKGHQPLQYSSSTSQLKAKETSTTVGLPREQEEERNMSLQTRCRDELRVVEGLYGEVHRRCLNAIKAKKMEEISVAQGLMEVATNKLESAQKSLEKCQKEKQEIDEKHRKVMDKYSATIAKFTEWQSYDCHKPSPLPQTQPTATNPA